MNDCVFSPDRKHRYALGRDLRDELPGSFEYAPRSYVLFVCLNPSTADEAQEDPTVRRCFGFARRWQFEYVTICNLFGIRSTDPKVLRDGVPLDLIGPDNDAWIIREAKLATLVVCAWGTHGRRYARGAIIRNKLASESIDLHVLGLTKHGQPKHPLYLRADIEPVPWR